MKQFVWALAVVLLFGSLDAGAETTRTYSYQNPQRVVVKKKKAAPVVKKSSILDEYDDLNANYDTELAEADTYVPYRSAPAASNIRTRTRYYTEEAPQEKFFHIGPYAGYANSTWSGASITNGSINSKSGYSAGIYVLIGNSALNYETGLRYVERGMNYSGRLRSSYGDYLNSTGDIEVSNKYLEIPAFLRYSFYRDQRAEFYGKAGAVLGMLQGSTKTLSNMQNTYNYYGPYYSSTADVEKTIEHSLNQADLRWALGAGTLVKINRSLSWAVDGSFERSFSAINKTSDDNAYLQSYMISTGLVFNL